MSVIQLASGATEADIIDALASLTEGGTVILPPGETIAITSGLSIDVAHRDITIDLNGGTLQQAANVTVITGRAIHTPMQEVALGKDAAGHTTVIYDTLPADLQPGAWIKLLSDDVLPGDHLDGTQPTRMGQALQVVSVEGNTVTLSGALVDQANYQNNIRATEYVGGELVIQNGEIVGDQSHGNWNAPLVQLRGLIEPRVDQLFIHDGIGKGISVVDSVNATITDLVVKNLIDGAGTHGIGVHSLSSTGTNVTGLYAENVTHAADANAVGNDADSANASYYGGDIGMSVEEAVAYAARNFAWSWHSEAVNARFEHVLAMDSHGFLNARGIGNTIADSGGANNQRGIILYEWGDGDGRNITVDTVTLKETLYYSTIAINEPRDNHIIDSWFEAYGYTGPLSEAYATTTGTTYIRIDPANENDVITGSTNADVLLGGKGDDLVSGNAGNDDLWGGSGTDTLFGGGGRDRFVFHDMSEAGDVIADFQGGLQGDVIDLSVLRARLGWTSDDLIADRYLRWVQSGDDVLVQVDRNGGGDDFATLATLAGVQASAVGAATFLDRLSEVAALRPDGTDDPYGETITGTEEADMLYADAASRHLVGLGGNDLLYADENNDSWLEGGAGDDALVGRRGDDLLDGGSGRDVMTGGAGDDVYIVESWREAVLEEANAGFDTIRTSFITGGPLADNVEALTLLGDLQWMVIGNELDNVLTGNTATNVIWGEAGSDLIDGAAGNDDVQGGDGDDVLEGGAGSDRVMGDAGNDVLHGGDEDDRLYGGLGDDVLDGGAGADMFSGSYGYDTVTYAGAEAGLVADLTESANNAGAAAGDTFGNIEYLTGGRFDDILRGNHIRNTLDGGAGDDHLLGLDGGDTIGGGDGNDFIDGGALKDVLAGGFGDDTFYFGSVAEAGDRIADFAAGDTIALSRQGFGLDSVLDFEFVSFVTGEAPQASGTLAALTYDLEAGLLGWDADGAGEGKAVFIGELENGYDLTLNDFLIV